MYTLIELSLPHLAKQVDPLPRLGISKPLGILQLGGQAAPVLAQGGRVPLRLFKLVNQITVLNCDLPLGPVCLMKCSLE